MATRFYLTKNPPPAGAPTVSRGPAADSERHLIGDVAPYPLQSAEGIGTNVLTPMRSYALTLNPAYAGARSNIGVTADLVDPMPLLAGQSISLYYWNYLQASMAVFSIAMQGIRTLSGSDFLSGHTTLNVEVPNWSGKISYFNDSLGVGGIGTYPIIYYVWRPGVGLVGDLATVGTTHPWFHLHDWSVKTNALYKAAANTVTNIHGNFAPAVGGSYQDVTGIQDGDLLCVEYWCGRYYPSGTWSWLPWDKVSYPDSVDGDRTFSCGWNLPVGGSYDYYSGNSPTSLTTEERSFIETIQGFSGTETFPDPAPQTTTYLVRAAPVAMGIELEFIDGTPERTMTTVEPYGTGLRLVFGDEVILATPVDVGTPYNGIGVLGVTDTSATVKQVALAIRPDHPDGDASNATLLPPLGEADPLGPPVPTGIGATVI